MDAVETQIAVTLGLLNLGENERLKNVILELRKQNEERVEVIRFNNRM